MKRKHLPVVIADPAGDLEPLAHFVDPGVERAEIDAAVTHHYAICRQDARQSGGLVQLDAFRKQLESRGHAAVQILRVRRAAEQRDVLAERRHVVAQRRRRTRRLLGAYFGMPEEILVSGKLKDIVDDIEKIRSAARRENGWMIDCLMLKKPRGGAD
jgi:hypothetical protein